MLNRRKLEDAGEVLQIYIGKMIFFPPTILSSFELIICKDAIVAT